ncbi:beta-ketoacyl-ACP synthase [Pleurocapsales cyanobacterium LEGE 06147]|nr:beta-ketoacyl-ACP synthase [Pleurocapsales cyanobacterium LEGE 06147]
MDVVVTGIGLLSALGSLTSSWQSLLKGKSGIGLHQPFPELPLYPLGLINLQPFKLKDLTKLIVAAALEDAQLDTPLPECGIVIGSSRGAQADWEQLATIQNDSNSPFPIPNSPPWLETLPHQGAIAAARYLGTTAAVLAPMAACATGIWAISRGFELIQTGECQRVIAGAVEAPITGLTLAGFERMGALAKTGCYPFDKRREGLVLGEGGAVFVLEAVDLALSRGANIYGQILGFGLTCDAHHMNAPKSDNRSALIALKQCLERSRLHPSDIDYIHAHGTGTKLNDLHEAQLINYLFPQKVAISSSKGATGHPLGASGAMGVAFSLMALKEQQLPPCIGLKESEFDLNLVTFSRKSSLEKVLCFSFGFGGQNTAIALSNF